MNNGNRLLKKCPFCGGDGKIIIRTHHYGGGYGSVTNIVGIGCLNKKCNVNPRITCDEQTKQESIQAWNTRIK